MTTWLLVALGVALASGVVPLISVEVFLVALVTQQPHLPYLWLGLVIGVGQVAGKLVYFYAARGAFTLPRCLRDRMAERAARRDEDRRPRWTACKAWWRAALAWLRDRCHRHPHWMVGTHAASSFFGLPPFMASTVLAGLAGMSLKWFLAAGLSGRILRFTLLAASPAVVMGWLS